MNRQARERIVTAEVRKLERRQAIARMADGRRSETTATPAAPPAERPLLPAK